MAVTRLSELECCVLAVVKRAQPCTAYRVRTAFQTSLTASWRASTGAIYPLVRKLAAAGLLSQSAIEGDARGSQKLSLTPRGEAELLRWVRDVPEWLAEPVAEPIRTRSYALELLDEGERHAVVAAWLEGTRQALVRVEASLARNRERGDQPESRALLGVARQLAARLAWLEEIAEGSGRQG